MLSVMGDMGDITLNIVLVRDLILEDFEEIKNMGGTMEVNHKKIHKNCILSYTPVSVLQQSSRPTMFGRRCAAKWPKFGFWHASFTYNVSKLYRQYMQE